MGGKRKEAIEQQRNKVEDVGFTTEARRHRGFQLLTTAPNSGRRTGRSALAFWGWGGSGEISGAGRGGFGCGWCVRDVWARLLRAMFSARRVKPHAGRVRSPAGFKPPLGRALGPVYTVGGKRMRRKTEAERRRQADLHSRVDRRKSARGLDALQDAGAKNGGPVDAKRFWGVRAGRSPSGGKGVAVTIGWQSPGRTSAGWRATACRKSAGSTHIFVRFSFNCRFLAHRQGMRTPFSWPGATARLRCCRCPNEPAR